MLDREILLTNYGVSYGSVTLKSLQNDNVPELDLLVREAIQNSSDASLNEDDNSFTVNFMSGVFVPEQFNKYISGLETVLNDMFPAASADFLEIRDTKTSGLTGKLRKAEIDKDDHGNFFKLIYDTGKRQTISTAGGNWGFGKSVYYRVGIGIVIFYSRVIEDGKYEDRLIITLVEDEGKKDSEGNELALLNTINPLSAGKAWWGKKDGDDLLPLTLSEQIKPILEIFGVKPFEKKETGTSIIIPYIDTKKLLDGIIPVENDIQEDIKDHFVEVWASSLSDYLKLAIQKWYAPKIHNRELSNIPGCDKKWLRVIVDNKPIRKQELLPFFDLVQELYTTGLAKTYERDYVSKRYPSIETYPINIRNYLDKGMTAGYISMIKITKAELQAAHSTLSPYDYIGRFEADGGLNEPIMMYARDPGMVIEYAITGPWVKNIAPPDNQEDYLFAFFVPDTKKRIKPDLGVQAYAGKELGEYLRECEASDHMGWNDPVTMQIVKRIQANSINQINKRMHPTIESTEDASVSKLANRVGRCLLPRIGYGKKPGGGGTGAGNGTKIHNVKFSLTSQTIEGNDVVMDYAIQLSHDKKDVSLSLLVASEAGWINAENWEKEIGTAFPVSILNCYVDLVQNSVADYSYDIKQTCSEKAPEIETNEIDALLKAEATNSDMTCVRFQTHVLNPEITGTIRVHSLDKKYQFNFKVE